MLFALEALALIYPVKLSFFVVSRHIELLSIKYCMHKQHFMA